MLRVGDVVSEGQEVEAIVLSVDEEKQRIGLSIKAAQAKPVTEKKKETSRPKRTSASRVEAAKTPLKGGIGRGSGGDQFGLKW